MGQWLYGMAVSKQHIHTVNVSTHAFIAVNNFLAIYHGIRVRWLNLEFLSSPVRA